MTKEYLTRFNGFSSYGPMCRETVAIGLCVNGLANIFSFPRLGSVLHGGRPHDLENHVEGRQYKASRITGMFRPNNR
ncbi:hypothetical protein K9B33_04900 [Sphingobium sp. 3R8]|uniref:hypothetical protein n=1 Tax=Sphingobium sp. 3R8 TaxID=2874921 RepID=UPI001CC95C4A|nr:hypothetical protein [Sphingobium sp. 3R8]MBZ9646873.1 hypothetical protein [Sphingobium sp. 3R8]